MIEIIIALAFASMFVLNDKTKHINTNSSVKYNKNGYLESICKNHDIENDPIFTSVIGKNNKLT